MKLPDYFHLLLRFLPDIKSVEEAEAILKKPIKSKPLLARLGLIHELIKGEVIEPISLAEPYAVTEKGRAMIEAGIENHKGFLAKAGTFEFYWIDDWIANAIINKIDPEKAALALMEDYEAGEASGEIKPDTLNYLKAFIG